MSDSVFIIAEAGVNHNGDPDLAIRLVDCAADAGADAVKFQTFVTDKLVTRAAKQAEYQTANLGTSEGQFEMLRKLELSPQAHHSLVEHCARRGIKFMSTAFDDPSIELLHGIGCTPWKIPSGEITNLPYLRKIGSFGQNIILSTGMATLGEVESALAALEGAGALRDRIAVLHCTTEYPAPFEEVNLRAMVSMGKTFGLRFGYSDHTAGLEVSIAAVALGASVIEKHFTMGKEMPGPDHTASLDPKELADLVRAIRHVESALGDGIKRPGVGERKNIVCVRKSIVAARPIKAGERLSFDNLTAKRPGTGISPMQWDGIVGKTAARDFGIDEEIAF